MSRRQRALALLETYVAHRAFGIDRRRAALAALRAAGVSREQALTIAARHDERVR